MAGGESSRGRDAHNDGLVTSPLKQIRPNDRELPKCHGVGKLKFLWDGGIVVLRLRQFDNDAVVEQLLVEFTLSRLVFDEVRYQSVRRFPDVALMMQFCPHPIPELGRSPFSLQLANERYDVAGSAVAATVRRPPWVVQG
jgi:hypothetical protein